MDSISDFVRGGRAGCGVQDRGISSSVPFFEVSGTQLVEISEILFGHTDYQALTRSGLSISINRTLRKCVREKKASEAGNWWKFFYGLQSVSVIGGPKKKNLPAPVGDTNRIKILNICVFIIVLHSF